VLPVLDVPSLPKSVCRSAASAGRACPPKNNPPGCQRSRKHPAETSRPRSCRSRPSTSHPLEGAGNSPDPGRRHHAHRSTQPRVESTTWSRCAGAMVTKR
jgi:hypothetical protein